MQSHYPFYNHVTNLLNSFSLAQVVNESTHFGHSGSSFNRVLMSVPETLCEYVTVWPVKIYLQVNSHTNILQICPTRRAIWRYKHANFNRSCELLSAIGLAFNFC